MLDAIAPGKVEVWRARTLPELRYTSEDGDRFDYATFFERRPAMAILLEGLLLNQTFFFVGYSLRDPNFRQVFSRIARMLREARRIF